MKDFLDAATLLSLSNVTLMRSHLNKESDERFIIAKIDINNLFYTEDDSPVTESFFIKIAAKNDIVKGYIECSNHKRCFDTYSEISLNMYSKELHNYMTQVYNIVLDKLAEDNLINIEGYVYQGKAIREFGPGHINEDIAN